MSSTSYGETIAERPKLQRKPREVELPRALGVLSRDVSPLGALDRSEDAGVRSERLSLDREAVNRLGERCDGREHSTRCGLISED